MAWLNSHTLTAFRALVRKDLWLWATNRRSVILGVLAPVLIAAFFGYLFDSRRGDGPSRIPVALTDLDGSPLSRQVVAGLQADPALELQPMAEAEA
ncbi:MAG: ABC transporter, partial [Burkholderiales bacterium PBB5]